MSSKHPRKKGSSSPSPRKCSTIGFEEGSANEDALSLGSKSSRGSKSSKSSRESKSGKEKSKKKGSSKSPSRESSKNSVGSKKGKVTSTPKETKDPEGIECEPDASVIKKLEDRYVPMPYTFRVPTPQPSRGVKKGSVRCPPYNLQLDHALAVVWTLFSSEESAKPLGVAQLQWSLQFLKGIHNRRGEHPKDVSLCIDAIQDELIQQYSDMVDDVKAVKVPCKKQEASGSKKGKNDNMEEMDEMDETNKKHKRDKHDKKGKRDKSGSKSSVSSFDTNRQDKKDNRNQSESKSSAASCKSDADEGNCDDNTCVQKYGLDAIESEAIITKQVPFSFNYADMIKKSPPCLEQLFRCQRGSVCSTNQQTRISSMGLDRDLSRENMVEFLKTWRREQVKKIQSELKRLRSIENFIGNVDADKFEPYLDDKQLDNLVANNANNKPSKSKCSSSRNLEKRKNSKK